MFNTQKLLVIVLSVFLFVLPNTLSAYKGDGVVEKGENADEEMRKAAQNPMADLMSFPIQNNTNFKYGPLEKTQNITNIQPVIPFSIGEDWNLITRTIIPLINQPEFISGQDSKFGMGDINMSLFVGPKDSGGLIWGMGPVLMFPTATDDRLGTDKWGAGPAAVVVKMQDPWVIGILGQNLWSFAGDSNRADVNQMLIQYFINYNLPDGWYLSSAPIITANWEAGGDDRWTVPFGGGFGRLFKVGKLPINTQVQAFYNVEKPDNIGPDWTLRIQLQTLLPKSIFK